MSPTYPESLSINKGRYSGDAATALVDGAVAQPSIAFADDSDTGIYSPADGQVCLTVDGEDAVKCMAGGAVELNHNNVKKLATASNGITITNGHITFDTDDCNIYIRDGGKAKFGTGEDLIIYHDGSNSYIDETATGSLILRASPSIEFRKAGGTEKMLYAEPDAQVELYYDDVKKFETTSTGITVTGACDATCFTGDSGTSYGYTVNESGDNHNVTDAWSHVDDDFEWALPAAGVYKLQASVRVRVWDENAWVAARYSGNAGDGPPQMLFEAAEAEGDYNSSCHILWVYTATAADTVELQFKSSTSNTGTSIQSDPNGRNFLYWERIG